MYIFNMNLYKCLFLVCLILFVSVIKGEVHQCNTEKCIPVHNCESVIKVLKQTTLTSEQITYLKALQCGFEGSIPKICCPSEFKVDLTSTAALDQVTSDLLPDRQVCGLQNEDRIFRGDQVDLEAFPWLALLNYKKGVNYAFRCGGVLINNKYVLTAAHCIKNIPRDWELVSVRLGENNLSEEVDCYGLDEFGIDCADPPLDINIEKQVVHELYDSRAPNYFHDIALLRLGKEVQFSDFIRPICLPNLLRHETAINEGAPTVVGWGINKNGVQNDTKRKTRVTILSSNECSSIYRKELGMTLSDSQICIQGTIAGKPCSGDIGGPLMVYNLNNYWVNLVVVGIESFGAGCQNKLYPKVYTNVSSYNEWIVNNIKS